MGLGVLFIGYVLLSVFTFAPTYFITDFISAFIMHEALQKLRRHAAKFKYTIYSVYLLFAQTAVQCIYYSLVYTGIIERADTVANIIEISRLAVVFTYTVTLLTALGQLALSVGDVKLSDRAHRNICYLVVSYALSISLSLDFDFMKSYIASFSAVGFLFKLLCSISICLFIYSCYMWICLEGDHDMEQKPSKIGKLFKKIKSGGATEEELEAIAAAKASEAKASKDDKAVKSDGINKAKANDNKSTPKKTAGNGKVKNKKH